MDHIPTAAEWNQLSLDNARQLDLETERARWSEKAPGYAHKRERSGYIAQMQALLRLEPGESAFDMGCGPGILSVPLALEGHDVVAVDFSDGMLDELRALASDAGVTDRIQVFRRAWQDDWSDLPCADVAFSSRSLTSRDFADAVAKLESKARKRVVISAAAGETPWCDLLVQQALGRDTEVIDLSEGFIVLLNYLLMLGRLPRVEYIVTSRRTHSDDEAELRRFLAGAAAPMTDEEQRMLDSFLDEHIQPCARGGVELDYEQTVRWAVITWDVPAK